jgi:hypothetical protein
MSSWRNLESSIARIFRGNSEEVVGCGFLITTNHLLTCAHVVNSALEHDQDSQAKPSDTIYFDLYLNDPNNRRSAQVLDWHPVDSGQRVQDIAILQILENLPVGTMPVDLAIANPESTPQVKIPGLPEDWHGNDFCWVDRVIRGAISQSLVQLGAKESQNIAIRAGFSGAPVWDTTQHAIVGMISQVYSDDEDKETAALMIPSQVLIQAWSGLAYISLENILRADAENLARQISYAYGRSCPQDWSNSLPKTLSQQLRQLNDMPIIKGHTALIWFAAHLVLLLGDQDNHSDLVEEISDWASESDDSFATLMQQIRQSSQQQLANPYLMIVVNKSTNKRNGDKYTIDGYFIYDEAAYVKDGYSGIDNLLSTVKQKRTFAYKDLATGISQILDAKGEKYPLIDFRIELFLPEELLNEPVDRWTMEGYHEPIGCQYQLIIRSINRISPLYLNRKGVFWQRQLNDMPAPNQETAYNTLILGDGVGFKRISQELKDPSKVGIKLVKEPLKIGENSTLSALESTGAPVAIWLREPLSDIGETEINDLLNCCLYQLPMTLMNQRSNAFAEDSMQHIGDHLAILWEDLKRLPPGIRVTLPQQPGTTKPKISTNDLRMI